MMPSKLRAKIIAERVSWIETMLEGLQALPLATYDEFRSDRRNSAAAESYLRRALEALLDLGRHILAKAFGKAVPDHKQIGRTLASVTVLTTEQGELLRILAGYRNRLVHFYQEVSLEELYDICTRQRDDIETVLTSILAWIDTNPDKIDQTL